jgi:arsenite methyltransferase
MLKLLSIKPVAHTLHNMNNDYDMRVPQMFQHLAILGILVMIASVIWWIVNPTNYAIAAIVIGVLLLMPTVLTLIITRSANNRRFRVRDGITHHAELKGHEQILDIGTGSGITLFGLAKNLTTGKATGIDIYLANGGGGNPKIFWKNADKEGVRDRVDLKEMDARNMTFASESFDVVVSTFAFHHIGNADSRRKAAQEIVRVLKPSGKVFVYDAGLALNELEETMRQAGLTVQRHGDNFRMVMGEKSA